MSQRARFFDAVGDPPDITYSAGAMAQVFKSLFPYDGVRTGLRVSPDSPAAMRVQVSIGEAWIQGRFFEVYDSAEEPVIAANGSGNPRIDRIIVRLDYTARTIVLAVLEGTPAASPAAPALTQSSTVWEISLARVQVASGATSILAASITDERSWVGAPRPGDLVVPTSGAIPPGHLQPRGQTVLRDQWPDLFDVIGETFGAGDGSSTFALPDLRGRAIVALDNLGGSSADRVTSSWADEVGGTGGAETRTLGLTNLPPRKFATLDAGTSQVGEFDLGGDWGISEGGTDGAAVPFFIIQPSMALPALVYAGVDRS